MQHPNVFNEIQMERRLLCERITPTKQTQHPFIVQMHAAFDDYEHIYYCMDLHVECGDLWSRLKHEKTKKMVGCHRSQAKHWLYQLVGAMEHMHKHGIVHRDLKVCYTVFVPMKFAIFFFHPWRKMRSMMAHSCLLCFTAREYPPEFQEPYCYY